MERITLWTEYEDAMLRYAIAQQDHDNINWLQVASHIPNRSNKDCRKRWMYILLPSINKGPWTDEENEQLYEGVRLYGTRWSRVAQVVNTRNPDQCSRRWHEALKPDIDKSRWSLYEDQMLRNAVRAHGRRWIEIVERYFPKRTPITARNRYNQLTRRDSD